MKSLSPNDLRERFLVEETQRISISSLLKEAKRGLKKTLINSQIETGGLTISLKESQTHFGGIRYWFDCPRCHRRVGVLFVHPLGRQVGCRTCLGLEYKNRRLMDREPYNHI